MLAMGCSSVMNRHWAWLITAMTFCHFFANYGFLYSYGQFFVIFQEQFGRGATITGWLGTIPFGLTYLASPIANALISRYQHRVIAVIGTFACFISLIVTSFMPSLSPMFFTFSLLYGLGINFVTVSGLNIILQNFPANNSARAVTVALAGCNAGLLAVNPLIYFLNKTLGWRNTLRMASAAILVSGVAAASTYTKPTPKQQHYPADFELEDTKRKRPSSEYTKVPAEKDDKEGPKCGLDGADIRSERSEFIPPNEKMEEAGEGVDVVINDSGPRHLTVLKYPELWMVCVALLMCSAAVCFFYMSLVNFLVSRGFDDETSALTMTALGISQVIGKIVVAIVGDNLPFPKIFALVIACVIGAVLMGLLLIVNGLVAIVAVIVASGLFVVSILDTLPHTLSHQLFHPNQCLVSWSLFTSSMGSGYIIGALLGESMDRTGSYDSALYVCMGFFLSSAVLLAIVPSYQVCCAYQRVVPSNHKKEVTC